MQTRKVAIIMCTGDEVVDSLLFDSEEEREEETFLIVCALAAGYIEEKENRKRLSFHTRDKLKWQKHVDELSAEGNFAFSRLYRMEYNSFMKLCNIIRPKIQVDETMSRFRIGKGPVTVEIMLLCLLRWLRGGSYLDIRPCAGIITPLLYLFIKKYFDAILDSNEMFYSFLEGELIESATREFEALSFNGAVRGCVASLDGYLLGIQIPLIRETGNVKAYFFGHYQSYSINIQAFCDHKCRFVYVYVAAPGSLLTGKFIAGDNACVCSEHLLTPFREMKRKSLARMHIASF